MNPKENNHMNLFKRRDNMALIVKEQPDVVSIAVPDIKQYLVNEYERVEGLKAKLEEYEIKLEEATELKFKYDATLVTLDEYSKRLKQADENINKEKQKVANTRNEMAKAKDELNTYKIMLHDAALTKDAIKDEIIAEFKSDLVKKINEIKGNLSKKCVLDIINC